MKKWIPAMLGATMIFSATSASVFAATPTAVTQVSAAANAKVSSNGYNISLDQNSLCSNTSLQKVLGLSKTELQKQFQAGKTLADLAKAKGVSTTKVTNALLQPQLTKLASDQKSGKLTQAKVTSIKTDLTKQLNNSLTKKVTTVTTVTTTSTTTSTTSKTAATTAKTTDTTSSNNLTSQNKSAAASALNLSQTELNQQIKAGKSIVDIAKDQGVNKTTVINTVVAKEKSWVTSQLNTSWKNTTGTLTTEQQQFKDSGYLAKAAQLFNTSADELQTQLKNGQTLTAIAKEKGVDSSKLTETLHTYAKQQVTEQCNQAS
ncbi:MULTISPECIES: hypothetical protein [Paenibacillus]|uniref:LysM domain-containing protein n=1 Tax=Paenibacillus pabuli TaxID=1472 RepID=A0A855XVB0_9BACL|nr:MULTISPECIES: hypothetical protein [Paenibacillus]PWW38046.1 hypothetical protein DET56_108239 [Paenibacillus pabuli]PXW08273.1 hypothetical protein DEU73_104239 [Paenibacillus taichungensis]